MRIVIPIKQVPETSNVKMDEEKGTIVRDGVGSIVNPLDLYAIEVGLGLRERLGGSITVLSMGPPKAVASLKEAVAMGCDEAILVSDRRFAGADTWSTSYVLSCAIRKLGEFDLILCGERATDGDTGQVGPGIGAWLDLPVLSYVSGIEVAGEAALRVRRMVETGYELLETRLPALLTVVKEVAAPRLPTLRGKKKAKALDVPVWTPEDIGADEAHLGLKGSPTKVVKVHRPKVSRECDMAVAADEGALAAATDRLAAFIGGTGVL